MRCKILPFREIQRNWSNTGKVSSSVSFSSVSYEVQRSLNIGPRRFVWLEMNHFWGRYLKLQLRSLQYDVTNLWTRFCPLVRRISGKFVLKCFFMSLASESMLEGFFLSISICIFKPTLIQFYYENCYSPFGG